jgi:cytochrome c nitrite reductase small subunit
MPSRDTAHREASMRSRGSVVTVAAAAVGLAAGLGGYAFVYAKGISYAGNDPATCGNCHVMAGHLAAWQKGPHHAAATCNDCHLPSGAAGHYATKAENGWHHSSTFTLGGAPDVLRARPATREVVEGQCRTCHAAVADAMGGEGVSCVRCHASVGHLP